jgi:glyoxylase-like metal-dependent hydrolase (beta-lactamase superfamily II)
MKVKSFAFNPFQENTYVLYDETGDCVIIDPGFSSTAEEQLLKDFLKAEHLRPVRLLNTHCHIDHILGNKKISEEFELDLEAHRLEENNIKRADQQALAFGMSAPESPKPRMYPEEGDEVAFGNTILKVLFTPGHSPGHVVFYYPEGKTLIGGDVLFKESIGRTDLPGGNFAALYQSITKKIFPLGDDVIVYPGHGPTTTIGHERENNPFLNDVLI